MCYKSVVEVWRSLQQHPKTRLKQLFHATLIRWELLSDNVHTSHPFNMVSKQCVLTRCIADISREHLPKTNIILLNCPLNFLQASDISLKPLLLKKYTPRYLTSVAHGICAPLSVIEHWLGLSPPNVISWLFNELNFTSNASPYNLQIFTRFCNP